MLSIAAGVSVLHSQMCQTCPADLYTARRFGNVPVAGLVLAWLQGILRIHRGSQTAAATGCDWGVHCAVAAVSMSGALPPRNQLHGLSPSGDGPTHSGESSDSLLEELGAKADSSSDSDGSSSSDSEAERRRRKVHVTKKTLPHSTCLAISTGACHAAAERCARKGSAPELSQRALTCCRGAAVSVAAITTVAGAD